ncbi:acetyltransferase [Herbaspirillum huttiense]|uniref:acetyltransferase n=1 Tax=Herbaspirillum huttiense TaxID=863372 RepID=UPI0010668B2B|nr:acetyltransferase [Herbaspirillum huttiense]QBP73993.1 acetyltransferase [Herbaspirillum huttiense]
MTKTRKLVIVGDSAFAEVAYEYFTHDSAYEVVAFAVEAAYLSKSTLFGLPVVAVEELEQRFPPSEVEFYAALVYTKLNRLRTRLYQAMKDKGYRPASYISSRAFVWPNVSLGEHCFIFEDNTVQAFAKIGNNVVLWSGNHIGHHSEIEDNCFISSHVVVSGFCKVGANTFMGVNATLGNNLSVGQDNWIGPSVTLISDTEANKLYKVESPEPARVTPLRFFKVGT